jgi:hypothetical protein
VTKIGDFIFDFLREFEAIFKKALIRVSGTKGELFDEKKQRSKILCQGPLPFRGNLLLKFGIISITVFCVLEPDPDPRSRKFLARIRILLFFLLKRQFKVKNQ